MLLKLVNGKDDIFINLPTGYGKSFIYQSSPLIYDEILKSPGHIVAVVSPLLNLIADQISYLQSIGVCTISITASEWEEDKVLLEFSVVYGTPEAWLSNEHGDQC